MAETEVAPIPPAGRSFEPLRWIGTYKILKGVLSFIGGLMILRLMHRSLPEVALHWMARLHIEPTSDLGRIILHRIVLIKHRSLGWLAAGLFAYVPLTCAEGLGLIFRKVWAEWVTVVTTAALIPLELHEIYRRVTGWRILLLVLNVAVLIYLIVRIRRDRHSKHAPTVPEVVPAAATRAAMDSARSTNPPQSSRRSDVPG